MAKINIDKANIRNTIKLYFYVSTSKWNIVFSSFFFQFMPIGVPKVPFRSPGEEDASWVDV